MAARREQGSDGFKGATSRLSSVQLSQISILADTTQFSTSQSFTSPEF